MKQPKISKGKKSGFEAWSYDKPIIFVEFAKTLALTANELYELINASHIGKSLIPNPVYLKGKDWCKLARQHHKVEDIIFEFLQTDSKDKDFVGHQINLFQIIRWINNWTPANFETLKGELSQSDVTQEILENHNLNMDIFRDAPESDGMPECNELITSPECQLFLQVTMPCWFEYYMPIGHLIRQTRNSIKMDNKDALDLTEKLLRLDGRFINDTVIGEYYSNLKFKREKFATDRIVNAMNHTGSNCNMLNVKYFISALIFEVSHMFDNAIDSFNASCPQAEKNLNFHKIKLKIPEIRALFDIIAKDKKKQLRDFDLPESDNTFQMGVRRRAKFVAKVIESYKNK